MKTSSAKAKGRRLQSWCATVISKVLDIPCGKDQLIESRESGQKGVDVKLIGEALHRFPFSIECKNTERWSTHKDMEQAVANQLRETFWLLVYSRNRLKNPVVMLDAKTFFSIVDLLIYMHEEQDDGTFEGLYDILQYFMEDKENIKV